jgi:hypothetical protein
MDVQMNGNERAGEVGAVTWLPPEPKCREGFSPVTYAREKLPPMTTFGRSFRANTRAREGSATPPTA